MNQQEIVLKGIIETILPKGEFKVKIMSDHEHFVQCRPSGKMRTHYIKMVKGDKVMVKLTSYDLTKGLIIYRGWR